MHCSETLTRLRLHAHPTLRLIDGVELPGIACSGLSTIPAAGHTICRRPTPRTHSHLADPHWRLHGLRRRAPAQAALPPSRKRPEPVRRRRSRGLVCLRRSVQRPAHPRAIAGSGGRAKGRCTQRDRSRGAQLQRGLGGRHRRHGTELQRQRPDGAHRLSCKAAGAPGHRHDVRDQRAPELPGGPNGLDYRPGLARAGARVVRRHSRQLGAVRDRRWHLAPAGHVQVRGPARPHAA